MFQGKYMYYVIGKKYNCIDLIFLLSELHSKDDEKHKRSISCRIGGGSCKWSCRLRGYIYGDCDDHSDCQCSQVK